MFHCASCFAAGDQTGSKLFSLVQRQLERVYNRKSAAFARAPGAQKTDRTALNDAADVVCGSDVYVFLLLRVKQASIQNAHAQSCLPGSSPGHRGQMKDLIL